MAAELFRMTVGYLSKGEQMEHCDHVYNEWEVNKEENYQLRVCIYCGDLDVEPYEPSDLSEDYFEPLDTTSLPELICPECGGSGRLVGEDYNWECYECNGSGEYTGTLEKVKTAMDNLRRRHYSWQQAWDEPGQSWDVISAELHAIDTKFWRWADLLKQLDPTKANESITL